MESVISRACCALEHFAAWGQDNREVSQRPPYTGMITAIGVAIDHSRELLEVGFLLFFRHYPHSGYISAPTDEILWRS
jgi:hypothetical protein